MCHILLLSAICCTGFEPCPKLTIALLNLGSQFYYKTLVMLFENCCLLFCASFGKNSMHFRTIDVHVPLASPWLDVARWPLESDMGNFPMVNPTEMVTTVAVLSR